MIWALLFLLGVPLWLCAIGITVLVHRGRVLQHREGNIPVRVLRAGHTRWTRGHAIWVSDVFAWRSSPAAWTEDLVVVRTVHVRMPTSTEQKPLHRLGDDPVVAVLTSPDGSTLTVAVAGSQRDAIEGPFVAEPLSSDAARAV